MKFGLFVPNVGPFADPGALMEIARRAEESGWDGFFIWDMLTPLLAPSGPPHAVDSWVVLSAVAAVTERIRLGPMITPAARRSAQRLARETVTLDRLSGGRLVLGAGLGDGQSEEFEAFGEEGDPRIRAEKLDEVLEAVGQLWSGGTTTYEGKHVKVRDTTFLPRPAQEPRIPVWIGGHWPHKRPIRRAARWDGMFPLGDGTMRPEDYRRLLDIASEHVDVAADWDLVHAVRPGDSPPDDATRAAYADVGVTWWLQMFGPAGGVDVALELAAREPPE